VLYVAVIGPLIRLLGEWGRYLRRPMPYSEREDDFLWYHALADRLVHMLQERQGDRHWPPGDRVESTYPRWLRVGGRQVVWGPLNPTFSRVLARLLGGT
jgi:hypothetical protein